MKYKIHYKGLDKVHNNLPIIEFMEEQGYKYYDYNDTLLYFKKKEGFEQIKFHVNYRNNIITKTTYPYLNPNGVYNPVEEDALFTKEELKFFDLLDYETESFFMEEEPLQDITDWIDM
jgi:hypothetical protein